MTTPTTPSRPTVTFETPHTAETPLATPAVANLQQGRKKPKLSSAGPPPKLDMAGKDLENPFAPGTESSLEDMIQKQYAKVEREARIQKEVITS